MADFGERTVLWIRSVPELDAAPLSHAPWLTHVFSSIESRGGQVELALGMCQVASFDGLDLEAAVGCARELVATARAHQPVYAVHIGLALGEVSRPEDADRQFGGAAWDRAQALSHRARPYEIIFDELAEQRGQEKWLFARDVSCDRVQGYALEPVHFSKAECRLALTELRRAALPHSSLQVLDELLRLRARPLQQRVLLRAYSEVAASQCIERLLSHRPPPLLLVVSGNAGCLRPLGSLALALRRAWPTEEAFEQASLHTAQRACLQALMQGAAVQRSDVASALSLLLHEHAVDDDRPHIVFEQLQEVDPASLAVLAEVLMSPEIPAFVLLTLTSEASAPAQLLTAHEIRELIVPVLSIEERAAIASASLSRPADDLALRIAALGGPDGFGLMEALRTLVASGDLIWSGSSFGWRDAPRQGAGIVPVEALITERAVGLPESAYRVLEAISCAPRQLGREFVAALTARDGLNDEAFEQGAAVLAREGWLDDALDLGATHAAIRNVMRNLIPPARAAELHGFAAELARATMPEPGFGSGEIAYHLFEAGKLSDAACALVEAAHAAMDMGFQRMALRLLATAVEWDPSTQIRKAARALARSVRPPAPPPVPGESGTLAANDTEQDDDDQAASSEPDGPSATMGQSALRLALAALTRRDFEATERWLDAMLADGGSLAPALRVLALSHLMRGDPESAVAVLQRRQEDEASVATRARDMLCWGLVRLAQGDPSQAIRFSLASLSLARQRADVRGEAAALQVLSFAYRSLERDEDALQLEAAAATRLQDHLPGSEVAAG
jgi:tetratricopeptide (TPR) repeat protein